MQKEYNLELERRSHQFREELLEIRRMSKKEEAPSRNEMEDGLEVTVDDFKSLIMKLCHENRLLQEERDLLLAKLGELMGQVEAVISTARQLQEEKSQWEDNQESVEEHRQLLSRTEEAAQNRQALIQELRMQLD